MLELKFMQKPIIQIIVLVFAVLFILDMGYRLFLEKSYYLQTTQGGRIYRINKKSGELYVIEGRGMWPVLDFKELEKVAYSRPQKKTDLSIFDPYKYGNPTKKVSYYIDWDVTSIVIAVFVCANTFVWIIIQRKRKYASSLP
jgi:hypothetical protein